jgi:hypothetical protein
MIGLNQPTGDKRAESLLPSKRRTHLREAEVYLRYLYCHIHEKTTSISQARRFPCVHMGMQSYGIIVGRISRGLFATHGGIQRRSPSRMSRCGTIRLMRHEFIFHTMDGFGKSNNGWKIGIDESVHRLVRTLSPSLSPIDSHLLPVSGFSADFSTRKPRTTPLAPPGLPECLKWVMTIRIIS